MAAANPVIPAYARRAVPRLDWTQPARITMHKPASASDEMPPHELPKPDPDENPEGTNATIHHPDPDAEKHPVRPEHRKERGPYTTGND